MPVRPASGLSAGWLNRATSNASILIRPWVLASIAGW